MNRDQVLEKIEPLTQMEVKEITHNPRTKVAVTPDMIVLRPGDGRHTLDLAEEGVRSMSSYAGIPPSLAQQVSPDLFGRLATELLGRKNRYSVIVDHGRVMKFCRPQEYRTVSPQRVLSTIERQIPDVEYNRALITDINSIFIEVAGGTSQAVVPGDLMRGGAAITFSPIGSIQPLVESYVLRLACTNGQTTNDSFQQFKYGGGGEGDSIWQFFRKATRDSYRALNHIMAKYRNMIEERVTPEGRLMVIEGLLKQYRITGKTAESVRALAVERPPENMYDVLNLVTYASSHLIEEPREIRRVQKAAASFMDATERARVCPMCHRQH